MADTLDHVVPHSYDHIEKKRDYTRRVCVPACRECNCLLSDKLFLAPGSRAGYLVGRYRTRYERLLGGPEWDEYELSDMGYAMRSAIEQTAIERAAVEARILKCELVARTSPSISDVWKAHDEEEGTYPK